MSDAFLERLVPSESMFLKTNDLVVALKKVSAEDVKGLSMEEGSSKFQLPGDLGNVATEGSVNAQVVITRIIRNHFDIHSLCHATGEVAKERGQGSRPDHYLRAHYKPHNKLLPVGLKAQLEDH